MKSSISYFSIGLLWLLLCTLTTTTAVTAQTCPPVGFDSLETFDLDGYIAKRWYVVKQLPVPYIPLNQFYCGFAQYTKITRKSLRCLIFGCTDPTTIGVYNFVRRGSVTGSVRDVSIIGTVTGTAKIKVTGRLTPQFLRTGSNYWIVAAGKWSDLPNVSSPPVTDDVYDWAVITSPDTNSVGKDGKCYSKGGFWMFSHLSIPPANATTDIETRTSNLGLSITEWLPVQQSGCQY